MKIINGAFYYNFINNGWIYVCQDNAGNYWLRSVNGNWAKIPYLPLTTDQLDADFQAFLAKGQTLTPEQLKVENANSAITVTTAQTGELLQPAPNIPLTPPSGPLTVISSPSTTTPASI